MKVGELARSSGLTVRTLHHYDEIGLLKPSVRNEAGYRLYSAEDVGRLHAIQALRHLGLSLADIGALLDGHATAPAMIIEQQMLALDRQIAQATELRDRLMLIGQTLSQGESPAMNDWLEALGLMGTFGRYFSVAELKIILTRWRLIESEWLQLSVEVRAAMAAGAMPTSPEVQPLVRRWTTLAHHWMNGDPDLMRRWGEMYEREPFPQGRNGAPDQATMVFMNKAITNRMALLEAAGLRLEDLRDLRYVPEDEWRALDAEGRRLVAEGTPPQSDEARALHARWVGLFDRLAGHEPELARKLISLQHGHPLLQAASALSPEVRGFLRACAPLH